MAVPDAPARLPSAAKRRLQFSLSAVMFLTLCVGGYLGGYRSGYQAGGEARRNDAVLAISYGVSDLIVPPRGADTPQLRRQRGDELIAAMTSAIEPHSWSVAGGEGEIAWFESNESLLVWQTQRVHEQVGRLLEQLRSRQADLAASPAETADRD